MVGFGGNWFLCGHWHSICSTTGLHRSPAAAPFLPCGSEQREPQASGTLSACSTTENTPTRSPSLNDEVASLKQELIVAREQKAQTERALLKVQKEKRAAEDGELAALKWKELVLKEATQAKKSKEEALTKLKDLEAKSEEISQRERAQAISLRAVQNMAATLRKEISTLLQKLKQSEERAQIALHEADTSKKAAEELRRMSTLAAEDAKDEARRMLHDLQKTQAEKESAHRSLQLAQHALEALKEEDKDLRRELQLSEERVQLALQEASKSKKAEEDIRRMSTALVAEAEASKEIVAELSKQREELLAKAKSELAVALSAERARFKEMDGKHRAHAGVLAIRVVDLEDALQAAEEAQARLGAMQKELQACKKEVEWFQRSRPPTQVSRTSSADQLVKAVAEAEMSFFFGRPDNERDAFYRTVTAKWHSDKCRGSGEAYRCFTERVFKELAQLAGR